MALTKQEQNRLNSEYAGLKYAVTEARRKVWAADQAIRAADEVYRTRNVLLNFEADHGRHF